MIDIFKGLFKREGSSQTAKDRLRLVLMSDHLALAPETVAAMKAELLAVISRYVEFDPEHADVSFESRERDVAMLASIPILSVRDRTPRPPPGGGLASGGGNAAVPQRDPARLSSANANLATATLERASESPPAAVDRAAVSIVPPVELPTVAAPPVVAPPVAAPSAIAPPVVAPPVVAPAVVAASVLDAEALEASSAAALAGAPVLELSSPPATKRRRRRRRKARATVQPLAT